MLTPKIIFTALNLEEKIGSFEVNKEFDALLIDTYAKDGPIDRYKDSLGSTRTEYEVNLVQRFVYLGDDRNIARIYVKGKQVTKNTRISI